MTAHCHERPACMKCKSASAQVAARQREPLCHTCLCEALTSKVRGGVRGSNSIVPQDMVLAALSGGAASQAMLYFLKQMHNTERSRLERGQVAFKLQAVHVDEAAVNQLPDTSAQCTPPQQLDETCERFSVELHTVPLEAVFLELTADVPFGSRTQLYTQQEQLHKLLQAVVDITGKEDLVAALRRTLLLRVAAQLSCNKLAIGTSATRMAVRTVAMSIKGSGYALPGALQFTDSRYGGQAATVIQPVREVGMRELAMMCHFQKLPVLAPQHNPISSRPSINTLAEDFVARLQATVPSSVSTIIRTACKLQAFPWNQLPDPRRSNSRPTAIPDVLCPICSAPLTDAELQVACQVAAGSQDAAEQHFADACCFSCQNEMLQPAAGIPGKKGSVKVLPPTLAMLPPAMQQRTHCILRAASCLKSKDACADIVIDTRAVSQETRTHMRAEISAYLLQ